MLVTHAAIFLEKHRTLLVKTLLLSCGAPERHWERNTDSGELLILFNKGRALSAASLQMDKWEQVFFPLSTSYSLKNSQKYIDTLQHFLQ